MVCLTKGEQIRYKYTKKELQVCKLQVGAQPIPEGAVVPRGAAFRLRLMSPVHKEPRCPLVCLQKQTGDKKL